MSEIEHDTTELSTFTRPIGGTDPHPATPEQLLAAADAQLDTVSAALEGRGTVEGAQVLLAATRELVTLAQSLDGAAAERVEMLRSTAAAVLEPDEDEKGYDAVMGRVYAAFEGGEDQ